MLYWIKVELKSSTAVYPVSLKSSESALISSTSQWKEQGSEMCQAPAFILSWCVGMASEWLCIAAEWHAGAADSRANTFVSCRLSLTTESKKNGRLYRGLLFLVLFIIVFVHYITPPPLSFAHSALYLCSSEPCGLTFSSCPAPPRRMASVSET